ncbi:hypothetical protein HPB51_017038 [Rhipicephalus microplus]|uniref:Secreted protein n=1 Tax=Rhipicephalus microplus TaxID=6941 RepID=A0A9J6F4U3_RHIMP|nr:hypothetical protein HPB51_017038 [Rhipicephalus microplus]
MLLSMSKKRRAPLLLTLGLLRQANAIRPSSATSRPIRSRSVHLALQLRCAHIGRPALGARTGVAVWRVDRVRACAAPAGVTGGSAPGRLLAAAAVPRRRRRRATAVVVDRCYERSLAGVCGVQRALAASPALMCAPPECSPSPCTRWPSPWASASTGSCTAPPQDDSSRHT